MRDVQVAVWGLGPHAIKNVIPALKGCPGINLYGVCSRNVDVVAEISAEYECECWGNPTRMLEDRRVEVVYLSTPIGLHVTQGESILLANKHLWCEKPIGEDAQQIAECVRLSKERGRTLTEAFMYLYHSQFLHLQEILKSGRLGRIQNITCRFGIPSLARPGFRTQPELGGGAFLDVGSYPISATVSLFPHSDPEILLSEIITPSESPVDSAGRSVLRYRDGVHVTLEWAIDSAYRNEIDVWGSEGSVFSDRIFSKPAEYVPRFRFSDLRGTESHEFGRPENHFLKMFKAFRALIDDPAEAEKERLMILRRVQLLDLIKTRARALS